MKNLENYGVLELDVSQSIQINGGNKGRLLKKNRKMIKWIKGKNFITLYFFVFFLDNTLIIFLSLIANSFNSELMDNFSSDFSLTEVFVLSIIIGPIIETFIFQFLIIEILYKFKLNYYLISLLSALAFGFSHSYNYFYILVMIILGWLYAIYYIYLKENKKKFPFLVILSLHALSNFISFLIDDIYGLI